MGLYQLEWNGCSLCRERRLGVFVEMNLVFGDHTMRKLDRRL